MALINPSTLYSGGNVRLDSTPYLRMAMYQRLRKQALDEASTQYFTKLPEKLNTAGVRSQDMEDPEGNGGIQQDIENWQSQWATNKDAIKKGGMAQQQFMSGFEKIRQRIQESKSRGKTETLAGLEAVKPNGWKPEEEDFPILDAWRRSIYNPKSKKEDGVSEYGLNDLSLAAAPYTPQYELKHDKVITANVQPDKLPEDKGVFDPIAKKITYTYGYTPEKVNAIVQNGLSTLKSDRTMFRHYKSLLTDPTQVEIASKALQQDYDKTHTDGMKVVVDTPEEMYAGLQMNKYSNAKIPKTFTDKASIDAYNAAEWDRRNAITNRQRIAAAALSSQRKDTRLKAMLNYQIEDPYEKALEKPVTLPYFDPNTIDEKGGVKSSTKDLYDISDLTPTEKEDLLGKGTGGQKYQNYPMEINGKEYLQKGKDGELLNDEGEPIDREQPFINRYKRMGTVKKGQAKGELQKQPTTKKMSLAERMKAAKAQQ